MQSGQIRGRYPCNGDITEKEAYGGVIFMFVTTEYPSSDPGARAREGSCGRSGTWHCGPLKDALVAQHQAKLRRDRNVVQKLLCECYADLMNALRTLHHGSRLILRHA